MLGFAVVVFEVEADSIGGSWCARLVELRHSCYYVLLVLGRVAGEETSVLIVRGAVWIRTISPGVICPGLGHAAIAGACWLREDGAASGVEVHEAADSLMELINIRDQGSSLRRAPCENLI
jgi:hypothetical protein